MNSTTSITKKMVREMGHCFSRTYTEYLKGKQCHSIKFCHTVINDEVTLRKLLSEHGLILHGIKFIPPQYHGHFWGTRVYVENPEVSEKNRKIHEEQKKRKEEFINQLTIF